MRVVKSEKEKANKLAILQALKKLALTKDDKPKAKPKDDEDEDDTKSEE